MIRNLFCYLVRIRNPNFDVHKSYGNLYLFDKLVIYLLGYLRYIIFLKFFSKSEIVFIGSNVLFSNRGKIALGKYSIIGDNVKLDASGLNGIVCGSNCRFGAYSQFVVSTTLSNPGKGISLGNNVGIGEFSYVGGAGGVEIGDDVIVGQYFSLHPENHGFDLKQAVFRLQKTSRLGIKIGNNCWIGSKVTILDGVSIGNNCVVAAGSVVTKNFPDGVLIGGVPAKCIKYLN